MKPDTDEIKQYYGNLLIVQYKEKPKALATIQLLASILACDGMVAQLLEAFDLDTACGAQLDILGRIVGVSRNVYGLDLEHTFFSFTRYDGSPESVGFGRFADEPYSEDIFLRYRSDAIYTMTDFELRVAIKAKIIFNNAYSSLKSLKDAFWQFFNGDLDITEPSPFDEDSFSFTRYDGSPESVGFGRFADEPYTGSIYRYAEYEVMKIDYFVKSAYTNAWAAIEFLEIVPKPMGVTHETHYI